MSTPQPPLFFLHIPKAAGSTIAAILEQHYDEPAIVPHRAFDKNEYYVTPDDVEHRLDEMRDFALFRGHYAGVIRERFFADRFALTILREPRARLVSYYNDWRTKSDENAAEAPPAERELIELARERDLYRFLTSGHPLIDCLFRDAQARQVAGSLWDSARPDPGDVRRALDRYDLVGTTALIDATIAALCRLLGWTPPGPAPRLNPSRVGVSLSRLDARTLALIDELTPLDRVAFEHAQTLCSRRLAELVTHPDAPPPAFEPRDRVDVNMLAPIEGWGWHVREGVGTPRVWRWTGPERESTLLLPLAPGRDYRVRLWIISVIASDIIDGVHLAAGGRSLYIDSRTDQDGQVVLEARLPARLVNPSGPTRFSILVPRVVSHAEIQPETGDHRPKGLAITRVQADPV